MFNVQIHAWHFRFTDSNWSDERQHECRKETQMKFDLKCIETLLLPICLNLRQFASIYSSKSSAFSLQFSNGRLLLINKTTIFKMTSVRTAFSRQPTHRIFKWRLNTIRLTRSNHYYWYCYILQVSLCELQINY